MICSMKQKKWYLVGLLLLGIVLFGLTHPIQTEVAERRDGLTEYRDVVQWFRKVTPDELMAKQEAGQDFCLYIGRGTCPYCRHFVQQLKKVKADFYYIDSENKTEPLSRFRIFYNIKYVPYFGYFKGGQQVKVLKITPQTTSDDIQAFCD